MNVNDLYTAAQVPIPPSSGSIAPDVPGMFDVPDGPYLRAQAASTQSVVNSQQDLWAGISASPIGQEELDQMTSGTMQTQFAPHPDFKSTKSCLEATQNLDAAMFTTDLTSPQSMADQARLSDMFSGL